jgi:hypothetical protein
MSTPAAALIRQIRDEAERVVQPGGSGGRESKRDAPTAARVVRPARRLKPRASARVVSGWTGLAPGEAAPGEKQAGGPDKLMRMVRKLKHLVHLAEGAQRSDARRQARLSADEAPAAGGGGPGGGGGGEAVDIEVLGREVLEVVNRELEMRRERRQEDSDVGLWW